MLTAVRNPLVTAAIANGHLKKYQLVVNGILIMVAPLLYIVFKLGAIVEWANIILLIAMFFAVLASAFMLQEMVFLDFKTFIKEVIYKIITVTFLSFIVPFFLYINMEEGWQRLIILGIFSTFTTICIIYYIGLTPQEGKFIKDNIIKKIYK